jgi:glycosyltransferase involved in cell wall biosynthesis
VGSIRVSAIDKEGLQYDIPVDLVIDQYNPQSWKDGIKDILARASESQNPTVVLLQHEYGLDPDEEGNDGDGTNFVEMARAFTEKELTTLVYLHTVLDEPDPHKRQVLQDVAKYSDGLIVTTESAIKILESKTYGIEHSKLKHIDHGIRMQHPSQHDRLAIKEQLGLKGCFLVTTLGLLSPDKGIQHSILGLGKFLEESFTEKQRENILYLIAGQCHPEFVKADEGREYNQYQEVLNVALECAQVRWCRVKEFNSFDFKDYDVVFLDTFLDENTLLMLYGATNLMLLPYLNTQQISSGILADTVGSGRVAVVTKSRYALELIHSNKRCPEGVVIGRHARGILIDPGIDSIEQIAEALDFLVFHPRKRIRIEKQAHQRGYQMRWQNAAWALLQHIEFVREEKGIITGRGVKFKREKISKYKKI